jgi:chromosome segregation ATPase
MGGLDALEAKMREYADRYDDLWQSKAADAIRELRGERDDYKVQWERDSTALGKTLNELSMKLAVIQDLRAEFETSKKIGGALHNALELMKAERDALRVELMHERELADAATLEIRELRAELATLRRELAHNCTRETEISNERHELRAALAAVEKERDEIKARLVSHAMACPVGDLWDFIRQDAALAASSPEASADHRTASETSLPPARSSAEANENPHLPAQPSTGPTRRE